MKKKPNDGLYYSVAAAVPFPRETFGASEIICKNIDVTHDRVHSYQESS